MAETVKNIVVEIVGFMRKCGGRPSAWYVGISQDAAKRLFDGHNVARGRDPYIYRTAASSDAARRIEKYFVDKLGTDGAGGGGGPNAKMVYAYKKGANTDP